MLSLFSNIKTTLVFFTIIFSINNTQAQVLKITSALHNNGNTKVAIYQEWPKRVLIDTPMMANGFLSYTLPASDSPTVYSFLVRNPIQHAYFFASGTPVNILISKDSMIAIESDMLQKKLDDFEKSLKPLKKQWRDSMNRYIATKDLDEKIRLNAMVENMANEAQQKKVDFTLSNKNNIAGAWMAYDQRNLWMPESLAQLVPAFEKETWAAATYNELLGKQATLQAESIKGQQAPGFTLPSIDGKSISLNDVISKNKYVLVDFWASWCAPCRAANRKLVPMYNNLRKKGVEVVSISVDEDKALWEKAVAADKTPWIQLISPNMASKVPAAYKVTQLPGTCLIDKTGKIIMQHVEPADLEKF